MDCSWANTGWILRNRSSKDGYLDVVKKKTANFFIFACRTFFFYLLLCEQWWRSDESTRLPQTWPGFDCQIRRHVWVEFVGSLLCSEKFSSGYSGFPLSSKSYIWLDLIYVNFNLQCPQLLCFTQSSFFSLAWSQRVYYTLCFSNQYYLSVLTVKLCRYELHSDAKDTFLFAETQGNWWQRWIEITFLPYTNISKSA